jgi:acyl phosphate:glycerol-3-phosphate acyltransferase
VPNNMTWMQQIFGQSVPKSHFAGIFLCCYALGCFTTAYYLVRFRLGLDIRDLASGSVGARNAGRVLGIPGFLITLFFDCSKGFLAVWVTFNFTRDAGLTALAMLAVVIGHVWPIQLGFRGGKGVATSIGALVFYDFHLALAFLALFATMLLLVRRTTLGGLIAFAFLPLVATLMEPQALKAFAISILAGIILIAHRKNLMEEFSLLAARRHVQPKPDQPLE